MGETPSPGSYVVLSPVPLKLELDEREQDDYDAQTDLDAVSIGVPFGTEYKVGELIRFGKQGMYLTVEPIDSRWFAQIDKPTMDIWTAELGRPPVSGLLCHYEYWRLPWHPICVHAAATIQRLHPKARIRLWNSREREFREFWEQSWDDVIDWVNEQLGVKTPDSRTPDPQPKKRRFWSRLAWRFAVGSLRAAL